MARSNAYAASTTARATAQIDKQMIPADLMIKRLDWLMDVGCTDIAVTSLGDGAHPPPARRHQLRAVPNMMVFAAALPTRPNCCSG